MTGKTYSLSNGSSFILREASLEDLNGIFTIYDYEVLNSTVTFDMIPKSQQQQVEWFHMYNHKYPIYVAEQNETQNGIGSDSDSSPGMIIGWSRLYAYSPRPAYDRTAECATYVHFEKRGLGIGKILLEELIKSCPSIGVKVILAKITTENTESIKLHERFGFKIFGVLEQNGEKFGRILDVTFMSLHLSLS